MDQPRSAPWTRRCLLTQAAGLAAATTVLPRGSLLNDAGASAGASRVTTSDLTPRLPLAPSPSLIDHVTAVCQRLAPEGWRDLLLAVSNDELDIATADLSTMLSQPLSQIDRTVPGFEDFALEGTRGIEPGSPARSLLFHALASPNVFRDQDENELSEFRTPPEIEAVENYVY